MEEGSLQSSVHARVLCGGRFSSLEGAYYVVRDERTVPMALAQPLIGAAGRRAPISPRQQGGTAVLAPVLTVVVIVAAWQALAASGKYPAFVLPAPWTVLQRLGGATLDGTLPSNAAVTLQEAGLGFLVALAVALPAGYILAHAPLLERFLAPVIAASQAVPAVAVAPLLLLWLGNGQTPKVAVCAVIVVFPLLVTCVVGIRSVAREYLEVAKVFGVPRWEQILRVELPLAAPVLLGGVKLGLTLSMTGAVVGEFVASDQGLGYLLTFARENLDTPLLYATLIVLGAAGIALYSFVSFLERIVAGWQ
jgi:NitT/TauT family transport system permease protein